jgi:antitoxin PrlF
MGLEAVDPLCSSLSLPKEMQVFSMLLTEDKENATVSLILMQYIIPRYIHSTITSKGQVTIPAEVRRVLGVGINDKVAFQITSKGDVLLTVPRYRTLAELKGSENLPNKISNTSLQRRGQRLP